MTEEIKKIFDDLPPDFFGSVEVCIRDGGVAYAKITRTVQINNIPRTPRTPHGEKNDPRPATPHR
jgi:hypothetical protein